MSRSGYTDDCDGNDLVMWRGAVRSAIRGRRGQSFLVELRDAMDAMPVKELATGMLKTPDGCLCTLGVIAEKRGTDLSYPPEDPWDVEPGEVANELNIARALAAEIMFLNGALGGYTETPATRWVRMRQWVEAKIAKPGETGAGCEG